MKTKDEYTGKLGEFITDALEAQGRSINELAIALEVTYEHVRRIVRGESVPSKFVLQLICQFLHLNYKEAERLATEDKLRKKFGKSIVELAGKDPRLEPLERVWDALTEEQQADIIVMAQGWAKRNKQMKAAV